MSDYAAMREELGAAYAYIEELEGLIPPGTRSKAKRPELLRPAAEHPHKAEQDDDRHEHRDNRHRSEQHAPAAKK